MISMNKQLSITCLKFEKLATEYCLVKNVWSYFSPFWLIKQLKQISNLNSSFFVFLSSNHCLSVKLLSIIFSIHSLLKTEALLSIGVEFLSTSVLLFFPDTFDIVSLVIGSLVIFRCLMASDKLLVYQPQTDGPPKILCSSGRKKDQCKSCQRKWTCPDSRSKNSNLLTARATPPQVNQFS